MGLLDNKISQDDLNRVNDIRHHPDLEPGFDGGGDDWLSGGDSGGGSDFDGLDSLFSDDLGSSGGNDIFGGGSSGGSSFGSDSGTFGSNSGTFGSNGFNNGGTFGNSGSTFGSNGFGGNTFGNNGFGGLGGQNQMQGQQVQQKDTLDKMMDAGAEAASGVGAILVEMVKSFKERNVDDYGYLSKNLIITGAAMLGISIFVAIAGTVARVTAFQSLGIESALSGALLATTGIAGLGIAAFILTKMGDQELNNNNISNIPDEPAGDDNFTDTLDDNSGDIMDDLFGDDFDDLFGDDTTSNIAAEPEEPEPEAESLEVTPINYKDELEKINENTYLSRQTLVETFCNMFTTNTVGFEKKTEISPDSTEWNQLEAICLKALANLANCTLEEVNSNLESADKTLFAYELRLKRINKVKQPDALAKEIEIYVRDDDSPDATVTATISGDFYNIIIATGENYVVTFGDVFKLDYCKNFFLSDKNKLPMITGITELGKVIVDDAKNFDTMLVAGKPRSGKSWYVLSILMSLILFNTPEDVQFIIVDPKESNLFKTLSLFPHVCGLHNDKQIIKILDDIIEVEAPRRKKLLSDNRCDDIWALRKKGIRLPVLYLVIDEYITVINNLDKDAAKEFDGKIQTLISQLPSQGIRLLFVPHRATGVVNKTNRTMLQFTAAVRADIDDVIDTLGVKKWDRALTKPGDIAIKTSSTPKATYVKGAALTPSDEENTQFMETAAAAFYKMGVDIPDMSSMRIACNRDEEYVQSELGATGTNRVQYDASAIINDLDNIDLDNL
jgi:S-DNA-T family DNA segregation ATPase FtsK/SpoIIIE